MKLLKKMMFISTALLAETKLCFKVYFPMKFLLKIKMGVSTTYNYHEKNVYPISEEFIMTIKQKYWKDFRWINDKIFLNI